MGQGQAAQREVVGLRLSGRAAPKVVVLHRARLVGQALAEALADRHVADRVTASEDVASALHDAADTDVLVLDEGLRSRDGTPAVAAFLALPEPPLVLLLGEPGSDPVAALLAGVRGWVPDDASAEELATALVEVAAGHVWMPTRLYAEVVQRLVQTGGWPPRAEG